MNKSQPKIYFPQIYFTQILINIYFTITTEDFILQILLTYRSYIWREKNTEGMV